MATKKTEGKAQAEDKQYGDCFIIMPIADCDGYEEGHFLQVYEDIIKPACVSSGYSPVRADDIKQTNLIHLDILQKLVDSPMAICDLSSRNPNVLFELGLRQAFDKPTVLLQEVGTPRMFDIAPLRYCEYRQELKYREVLEDQEQLADAIDATRVATSKGEGVNSIVSVLSLTGPAQLHDVTGDDSSRLLQLVRAEMSEMRGDFRRAMKSVERSNVRSQSLVGVREAESILGKVEMQLIEAQQLCEHGAPKELAVHAINRGQEQLAKVLDSQHSLPAALQRKIQDLFMQSEHIENKIMKGEA